jgi:hypothetical protein
MSAQWSTQVLRISGAFDIALLRGKPAKFAKAMSAASLVVDTCIMEDLRNAYAQAGGPGEEQVGLEGKPSRHCACR